MLPSALLRDGVVGPQVAVDRRIDVTGLVAIDDLADDAELARVEGRAEHQGIERLAAELAAAAPGWEHRHVVGLAVDLSRHPVGGVGDAVLRRSGCGR